MQYTLHLTSDCNFSCQYCNLCKTANYMSKETAYKAVDLALREKQQTIGLGFYGGEPLLCKQLIYDVVSYVKEKISNSDKKVFYKLTTNGLLLDDDFLEYAKRERILISLSLDGGEEVHDLNRRDLAGNGTYQHVRKVIPKLLNKNRYTSVLMTIAPNTVNAFADSVYHIHSLGFISIICSLDYSAIWDEKILNELKKQYKKLADFYYKSTIAEDKFFLSSFESKINSHIQNKEYCKERCILGYEQISVSVEGNLYPCIQFAGDDRYLVGDVDKGINQNRRKEIYNESQIEYPECQQCAIKNRCLHTCACINKYSTGKLNEPSPVLCANERMLIPIADRVAAKLYKKRSGMFIHKHYNEFYSLVSLVEDSESNNIKNGVDR